MRKLQIVIVAMLVLSSHCWAQNGDQRIYGTNTKYDQGDWITYGQTRFVTAIALGQQYVYFGTTGGITRYDYWQKQWDFPFTVSSGMADNNVKALAFDENTSLLWAATANAVSVYTSSSEQWANYYYSQDLISGHGAVVAIGFSRCCAIFEMRDGELYSCSNTGGALRRYNQRMDGRDITWTGYHAAPKSEFPQYFMDPGYHFLYNGVIQDSRLHKSPVTVRLHDKWFQSWIGSWGFGALFGDIRALELSFLPFGLFARDVRAIAIDQNGMWIAGENRNESSFQEQSLAGITFWDQVKDKWRYFESDYIANLQTDEVNRITVAKNYVIFATIFGVSIFNKSRNECTHLSTANGLNHEYIFNVAVAENRAYVASEGGLNAIDLRTLRTDSLEIYVIGDDDLKLSRVLYLEIANGLLWAATDYGIYVYDIKTETGGFVDDVNGPNGERFTAVTSRGSEVWFGTTTGIFPYDIEKKEWLGLPERKLDVDSPIYAMAANEKSVWAATDRGVFKLNRRLRHWVNYTRQDGLPSNVVREIKLDGDYVWFGTADGLPLFYWNDPNRVD